MSRRVGFTGSQHGMTAEQQAHVVELLRHYGLRDWFIHGGCVGADAEAHFLARNQGMKVKVWPAEGVGKKAVHFPDAEEIMDAEPPLDRNTRIVQDDLEILLACPKQYREVDRSGTWATIRRARRYRVNHSIILPNGHTDTVVYPKPIRTVRGLSW